MAMLGRHGSGRHFRMAIFWDVILRFRKMTSYEITNENAYFAILRGVATRITVKGVQPGGSNIFPQILLSTSSRDRVVVVVAYLALFVLVES